MGFKQFIQGRFKPDHPNKYVGDVDKIIYRSSWELALLRFLDSTPEILKYGSERVVIPYYDHGTMNEFGHPKQRRYYVDFIVQLRKADGSVKVALIEVKPKSQTVQPRKTSRMSEKTYESSLKTWLTNSSKWEAARAFCHERGWEFIILNEDHIFPQFKDKKLPKMKRKKATKKKL